MEKKQNYTLHDIAQLAGVSPSTVSRVLNRTETRVQVSEKTRKKIFSLIQKLDYNQNINAKRLWSKHAFTIGVVVPAFLETYHRNIFADIPFTETFCGLELGFSNTHYKMMLVFQDKYYFESNEYLRLFKEKAVDGLIFWGLNNNDQYVEQIRNYPHVLINSRPVGSLCNYIGPDNEAGCFLLTEACIQAGFRDFFFLGGPVDNSLAIERYDGFRRALGHYNVPFDENHRFPANFERENGEYLFEKLLAEKKFKPGCVIFSANDEIAFGAFTAAQRHGLNVPNDFLLCGADGLNPYLFELANLCSCRVPARKMGELAVKKLIEQIDGQQPTPPFEIKLPVELLVKPLNDLQQRRTGK